MTTPSISSAGQVAHQPTTIVRRPSEDSMFQSAGTRRMSDVTGMPPPHEPRDAVAHRPHAGRHRGPDHGRVGPTGGEPGARPAVRDVAQRRQAALAPQLLDHRPVGAVDADDDHGVLGAGVLSRATGDDERHRRDQREGAAKPPPHLRNERSGAGAQVNLRFSQSTRTALSSSGCMRAR